MNQYFEINENGHNIRCKLYYVMKPDIKRIIVCCHGFAGHKDSNANQKFAKKVLSKYKDVAVLTFDWPCHGKDVKKKLVLRECSEYLRIVTEYIKKQYHTDDIFAYATSFGGYLVLKYIEEFGNPFRKIALRCPAVNMYDVLTSAIMKPDEYEKIQKGKNVLVGFDRKIEINLPFLQDLQAADIRKKDYMNHADDILILHGTKDEIVPYEEVRRFSDANIITFIPVEAADHRFLNSKHMDLATKTVLEFFTAAGSAF